METLRRLQTIKIHSVALVLVGVILAIAIVALIFILLVLPPKQLPDDKVLVSVDEGQTIAEIATELEEKSIIRSDRLLRALVRVFEPDLTMIAGEYLFERPMPLTHVVRRLARGDFGDSRVRVTILEGATRADMAELLSEALPEFDAEEFLEKTEGKEGYLFPDTYLFFPNTKTSDIVETLEEEFEEQIEPFLEDIEAQGKTVQDIVTMASIIEREAYGARDSYVISGILWKRIEEGMLLQVDAPFVYLLGKGSAQLTRSDLAIDSPYNTYVNKGLPPGAIGNPGLLSLESAVYPEDSPYFFYLHGNDGRAHYAETYSGHLANKRAYIN